MDARTDPAEPNRTVIEQAAMWQARLADEESDSAERTQFDRWLNEQPSHRIAFDRMSQIAGRVAFQDEVGQTALAAMLSKRSGRAKLFAVLLLGTVGLLGWEVVHNPLARSQIADQRTAIGEVRSVPLATADSVTLDSNSAVDVDEAERTVRLWRGGLLAKVKHGVALPFMVRTPQGTARALGTAFSVRIEDGTTIVTVMQSRVEACTNGGERSCVTLGSGQSARLDSTGAHRLANVDPVTEAAWSDGLLIADDMPLAEVIDRLNHYRETPIRYQLSELAGLRISGAFPITDSDRALASVSAALPVRVERAADGIMVRHR